MSSELRVPRNDLAPGRAMRIDAGPTGVCLVRIDDDFYAIGDRCSHADVSLSEGDIDVEDCWIECWKHGSAFSLRDGSPQSLPATQPVPVYPVSVDGEEVVVSIP
jgi:3-phenylpropionate/trans-cinnamate dioxygenase ferredoxin subunit